MNFPLAHTITYTVRQDFAFIASTQAQSTQAMDYIFWFIFCCFLSRLFPPYFHASSRCRRPRMCVCVFFTNFGREIIRTRFQEVLFSGTRQTASMFAVCMLFVFEAYVRVFSGRRVVEGKEKSKTIIALLRRLFPPQRNPINTLTRLGD